MLTIVSAVVALTTTGHAAACQVVPLDSTRVLAAAIESVRSSAPRGATGFGFADTLHISESMGAEIARIIGVEYGELKMKRVCARPRPSDCHLVGLKVFIQVTEVQIDRDRAQVLLTVLEETTSHRQPIHYMDFRVRLARSESSWQPTDVTVLAET
jgi:hypothetical protein